MLSLLVLPRDVRGAASCILNVPTGTPGGTGGRVAPPVILLIRMKATWYKAEELNVCPAWPDNGHECARVAGTLCGGQVQGTFAQKLINCMECDFYKSEHYHANQARASAGR